MQWHQTGAEGVCRHSSHPRASSNGGIERHTHQVVLANNKAQDGACPALGRWKSEAEVELALVGTHLLASPQDCRSLLPRQFGPPGAPGERVSFRREPLLRSFPNRLQPPPTPSPPPTLQEAIPNPGPGTGVAGYSPLGCKRVGHDLATKLQQQKRLHNPKKIQKHYY